MKIVHKIAFFALLALPLIWLSTFLPLSGFSGFLVGLTLGALWDLIAVEYFRPAWRVKSEWFVEWRTRALIEDPETRQKVGVHVQCGWHGWSILWRQK